MTGRGSPVLIILSTIVALGAVSVVQAHQSPSPMGTRVAHVRPFLASGGIAAGYRVSATRKGYCWTTSSATPRPDAFRCFVGNELFDPCFRNPAGTRVACSLNPPTRLLIIRLTKTLPAPQAGGRPEAFVLATASGAACRLATGATWLVDGKRANFACTDGFWLYGRAKTHQEPWKILRGKAKPTNLTWVSIRTAWF